MKHLDENVIEKLKGIGENLDMAGLNDQDAWNAIAGDFEEIVKELPDIKQEINLLMAYCAKGARAVPSDSGNDSLTLIDAIARALEVLTTAGGEDTAAMGAAISEMKDIIGDLAENNIEECAGATLDDAAALWIQLSAEDSEELSELKKMLDGILAQRDLPASVRQNIDSAIQILDDILSGNRDGTDAAMNEIGAVIENAMNDQEMAENDQLTQPADEAGGKESAPGEEAVADSEEKEETLETAAAETEDAPASTLIDEEAPLKDEEEEETPMQEQDTVAEPDTKDYMPADADPEMLGEFITEASDLIDKAEQALLTLETDPDDEEAVGTVFRAFHTVKGTSAFLELTLLSEMGHLAESLLSRVREKEIRYGGGYADLALRSLDMIKDLVGLVEGALGGQPMLKPEGFDDLMNLLEDPEAAGISDEAEESDSPRVGDILVAQGLADRETVELAASMSEGQPLGVSLVKSKAAKLTDVGKALRTQGKMRGGKKIVESSVRVGTQRLDRLIDMVGELVVAHSMVAQHEFVVSSNHHELIKKVNHASKIVRELQDISMSMRMIPMKSTFQKMARLVRDLSRKIGKNVRLVTEGEETEIDRNMVDIINDPLVHMIRNAVDHGIELPEVREATGKPSTGTVNLLAYHSAGSVVVEIRDDGKGLDRQGILEKARERGLIGEGETPPDRDIYNMIFEPGFSTAKTVTDVSGRGVGMDVVKKNLEALRGSAEIFSRPGEGCTFKMRLPLTLAIIDGMVVRVGGERFVIPTVSIIRTIQPSKEDLSTILKKGEMFSLQNHLIPMFRLSKLFKSIRSDKAPAEGLVVVVENDGKQIGLLIEELLGRQQVVIKTLGETMRNIPGISGGAIMPDGRVGLIVDLDGVVKLATKGSPSAGGGHVDAPALEQAVA